MKAIKIVGLLLIILFICTSCASANQIDSSWDENNLKGEVESIVSTIYNVEGIKTELSSTHIENYSDDGMILNKIRKDEDGIIFDQAEMIYSENNNLIKATFMDEELHGCASIEVEYNEDRTKVETKFFDKNGEETGRFITKRNKNGSKSEVVFYDANNELSNINQFFYKDNKLNEIIRKDIKNGHTTTYSITLDNNGNIIEEKGVDESGNNSRTITREFDQQNNLLLEITDFDGYGGFYSRHEYEYDNVGNWIKRIDYDRDSIVLTIIEREIKYYNR